MKATFPKDEGDEGASEINEPKWITDFCEDRAKSYIIQRCNLLMESGRYKDTEAIQKEFYY